MSKVIFRGRKVKEESFIPNTQLESMFLSIADDEMMTEYKRLIDKSLTHTASAYASHKVQKVFQYLRDTFIKNNGDIEYLTYMLFRRGK